MKLDAQLIDEALAGNSAAFGELALKYQDRLYNTVVHLLGSTCDAADVVQDALVQAFVKLDSYNGHAAFYTWLYRITINLALSRRRRRRAVVSLDQTKAATGEEPVGRGEGAEERIERLERAAQVQAALAALGDEHRTILVLREIDGCDYDTIAEVLELPVGTVRSRLHRARMELRNQLKSVLQTENN